MSENDQEKYRERAIFKKKIEKIKSERGVFDQTIMDRLERLLQISKMGRRRFVVSLHSYYQMHWRLTPKQMQALSNIEGKIPPVRKIDPADYVPLEKQEPAKESKEEFVQFRLESRNFKKSMG